MAEHTPGPWEWTCNPHSNVSRVKGPKHAWDWRLSGPSKLAMEVRAYECPPSDADARLIAAAPQLLEACKVMAEWFDAESDHSDTTFDERMELCQRSEDLARAAIAAATQTVGGEG